MVSSLFHPALAHCRRLFLRNYEVMINIGVHDFEKRGEQRVMINVELYVPLGMSTPQADKLDEVLYSLSESLRIVSILLLPILPEESNALRAQLNWSGEPTLANTSWGLLPDGHQLGEPVPFALW